MNKNIFPIPISYTSLLGGVFLSGGVSIYTNLSMVQVYPVNFLLLLLTSISMIISGLLWYSLASTIEKKIIEVKGMTKADMQGRTVDEKIRDELNTNFMKVRIILCWLLPILSFIFITVNFFIKNSQ